MLRPGCYIVRSDLTVLEMITDEPHDGFVNQWCDTWHSTAGRMHATRFASASVAGELLEELRSRWPMYQFVVPEIGG